MIGVLYVASVPAMIGLALVLPGTVLDTFATVWFETVFPNVVPGAAGYYSGMLLLAYASVLPSGFLGWE